MLFRLRYPLATNPRVKNLFEHASFSRVREYYRPKFRSIQVPIWRKDVTAKLRRGFPVSLREVRRANALPDRHQRISHAGTISRRQSQNVLLPVEIPPVIPIAGMAQPSPRGDAFGEINMKRLFHLRCAES